jgi:hypothetical protein
MSLLILFDNIIIDSTIAIYSESWIYSMSRAISIWVLNSAKDAPAMLKNFILTLAKIDSSPSARFEGTLIADHRI